MANIQQRKAADGSISYRAQIRLQGFSPQQATFARKTDAKIWAQQTEAAIREGRHLLGNIANLVNPAALHPGGIPAHLLNGRAQSFRSIDHPQSGNVHVHTALAAVPAYLTGQATRLLRACHRYGSHHQQLLDELPRQPAQQILDRELRLPDHRG